MGDSRADEGCAKESSLSPAAPQTADGAPPWIMSRRRRRLEGTALSLVGDQENVDDSGTPVIDELVHKLADALRAVRAHVPDPIWWDVGAADALMEYHARRHA